ncbi:MAG: efflux RND transporter periplasmic adaptor subunit [Pseudomonadota bacterium]
MTRARGAAAVLLLLAVGAAAQQPAPVVQVAEVTVAEIGPTVPVPGTVYSRHEVTLAAGADGLLDHIVEPGTWVDAGAAVAAVDAEPLRLQLAEQAALLARAEIQARQLEREWRRQKELRATSVVSEFQLEQTAANRDLALADADIIRVRMRQIEQRIGRATVRAPFAGLVVSREHQAGAEVTTGLALVGLTDPLSLEVRAYVPLKHLPRTRVGERLDVFDQTARFEGRIRALIPAGDVRSQTFEVRIDVPGAVVEHVAVGQLVSVAVPIQAAAVSLAVPRDALILREDGSYVYRIRSDNTAEQVPVELGDSAGDLIAVAGGLEAGDRVAVRGGETLSDGATVRIVDG